MQQSNSTTKKQHQGQSKFNKVVKINNIKSFKPSNKTGKKKPSNTKQQGAKIRSDYEWFKKGNAYGYKTDTKAQNCYCVFCEKPGHTAKV